MQNPFNLRPLHRDEKRPEFKPLIVRDLPPAPPAPAVPDPVLPPLPTPEQGQAQHQQAKQALDTFNGTMAALHVELNSLKERRKALPLGSPEDSHLKQRQLDIAADIELEADRRAPLVKALAEAEAWLFVTGGLVQAEQQIKADQQAQYELQVERADHDRRSAELAERERRSKQAMAGHQNLRDSVQKYLRDRGWSEEQISLIRTATYRQIEKQKGK